MDLSINLGPIVLRNPILVASGTFGYAREMEGAVDFSRLGGIIPKTVTAQPRAGNSPPRTVETPAGMLNSIGLDNDGIDHFISHHLPYLRSLPTAIIPNIAGKDIEEFVRLAEKMGREDGLTAIELNLSCPNVTGGVNYATNPVLANAVIHAVKRVCRVPIIAKLTPNVTDVRPIAEAVEKGGADAISLINTFVGMAVDWKEQRPVLGNITGGLSGPAIKPLALRCVWQAAQVVDLPIIGIGGIATIDDVMEFLIAGASAVQIGTANFYDPTVSTRIIDALPMALGQLNAESVANVVGTLE